MVRLNGSVHVALVLLIALLTPHPAPAQAQMRGANDYLEGLTALSSGKLDAALAAFSKAVTADDENPSYHTARAVVLYLQDKPELASDDINRSTRLGATPATQVWGWAIATFLHNPSLDDQDPAAQRRAAQQRRMLPQFDSRPPYESKEPYAKQVFDPAMHLATPVQGAQRAQIKQQLTQAAIAYAWSEMSGPKLAPSLMTAAKSLFEQKKFAECLALLDRLRDKTPGDVQLLYFSAGCKLQLGDFEAARAEYTTVLTQNPQDINCYFGRAQAAVNMGSIERANKDLAIAAGINSAATDAFKKSIADLLQRAAANVPKEPLPDLMAALKQSAADVKQPMTAVIEKGERFMRAAGAMRFIPSEAFTEELQHLDAAAAADSKNADKQAALGEFLINPTVVQPVRIPGASGNTRIPVGDANVARAQPALERALTVNPNHINALTQKALAAVATKQPNDAIQWVQKALDNKGNNLDLSRIYLDFYTNQANDLSAQAANLRQPKSHTEFRGGSEYLVTVYPSPAELAQAADMDRQADELRRRAVIPMQQLADAKKGTVAGQLAIAEVFRATRRFDDSIAAALAGLKIDPWDLDTHEFLVDLSPKVGKMDIAIEHQNILNNLVNPSAGRTLDKVWELLAATKYRSARETIDEAEKIEIASVYVPAYRAAVAQAEKKSDEFTIAARQAIAMEEGKQRANGRTLDANAKAPLNPNDVGLTMALRRLWAMDLTAQKLPAEAANQCRLVALIGQRVATNLWDTPVQASALPAEQNAKTKGWTVRELLMDTQFTAAHVLLDSGKPEDAARALMGYISTSGKVDMPPGAMDYGYEIYQKLGAQKSSQYFTANMMGYYQMKDGQAENRAILQRGDEIQERFTKKIEELRQRQADLQQQITTAQRARNTAQVRTLQNQQRQLSEEMAQAMQDMNREQMRNIDPNQGNSGR